MGLGIFGTANAWLKPGALLSFVSATDNNNPTYEFYPKRGDGNPITLNFLLTTLPANLYPLTWLLPSGNLFMTTNWVSSCSVYDCGQDPDRTGRPRRSLITRMVLSTQVRPCRTQSAPTLAVPLSKSYLSLMHVPELILLF